VLLVGGVALRPAFFHASCGGHTSTAADVFGEAAAGSAVSDVEGGAPRCIGPDFEWTLDTEREVLAKALGVRAAGTAVEPLRRDAAGRVVELRAFGTRFSGNEFHARLGRALGWQALRSMKFSAQETDTTVRFRGTGLGHGAGLCQRGAQALAKQGVAAKGILQRYFPESQVRAYPDAQ
jgi:stage II sporulation protein D